MVNTNTNQTPIAPSGGFQNGAWYSGRQFENGTFSDPGQFNSASGQSGAAPIFGDANKAYIAAGAPITPPTPPAPAPLPLSKQPITPGTTVTTPKDYTTSPAVRGLKPDFGNSTGAAFQPQSTAPAQTSATLHPGFIQSVKDAIFPQAYAAEPSPKTAGSSKFNVAKPKADIPDWVWNQVVEGAEASAKKYGVPASLTIAQFLQETGGNPNNFIGGTNVFGIKGSGNAGSVNVPTTEYVNGQPVIINANFAKYGSIADSIEAHAKLLMENPAYSKFQGLVNKGDKNPFNYAQALQGVYATDPNYAKSLQNSIATYGLAHADNYEAYPVQNDVTKVRQAARMSGGGSPSAGSSARLG